MAVVPRYWYVEAEGSSTAFQLLPAQVLCVGPEPSNGIVTIISPDTGEIQGEAILMSALPASRFCDFLTGKQVILPHRTAIALERLEGEFLSVFLKDFKSHIHDEVLRTMLKYRVEVIDCEIFALTPMIKGQWFNPFIVRLQGASAPLPALLPPGEGGGVPVKGLSDSVP